MFERTIGNKRKGRSGVRDFAGRSRRSICDLRASQKVIRIAFLSFHYGQTFGNISNGVVFSHSVSSQRMSSALFESVLLSHVFAGQSADHRCVFNELDLKERSHESYILYILNQLLS